MHEESRPSHSGSQPRRHLGEQQEGSKVGRAHARVVSNDGYPGYQVRRNDQPEAEMDDDDFSFMTPCWSLLEMAQVAVSQVGTCSWREAPFESFCGLSRLTLLNQISILAEIFQYFCGLCSFVVL